MTCAHETIAVYSESTIRTYGFVVHRGMTLVHLTPMAAALDLEQALHDAGVPAVELRMATALSQPDGTLRIQLLLEPTPDGETAAAPATRRNGPHQLEVVSPVEVIQFQGPHFGDRYGIAHAAVRALRSGGVELLAMGCTGASVYLAVGDGCADNAVCHLRGCFSIPENEPSKGPTP